MPEEVFSKPCDPQAMRGRVRRGCRFFLADFETFRGYVEMAANGCDRDNALIQRARDRLAAAHSAMHECLARHGYANRGSSVTGPRARIANCSLPDPP